VIDTSSHIDEMMLDTTQPKMSSKVRRVTQVASLLPEAQFVAVTVVGSVVVVVAVVVAVLGVVIPIRKRTDALMT
jgi:hypothetical protein